ncbi:MAG: cytochrome c oxidase subunit II, partial [Chloroflexota bacterium]|nr:cytochrome c oxidase subunit II [Chloroflexota bacterium]
VRLRSRPMGGQMTLGPLHSPFTFDPPTIPFSGLFTFLMLAALAVVLLVSVLLVLALMRRRPAGQLPRQTHGSTRLERIWTLLPALVVVFLFGLTLYVMRTEATPGAGLPTGGQPDVVVVGQQWWWEIRYPKLGIVTANELHLPVGRRLLVQLTSAQVQHDFWVPQLGQKMDMYPGKSNYIWLEAPKAGEYHGACAEYCGVQHAWMRILAVAQSQADFDRWAAAQKPPAQAQATGLAAQGRAIFSRSACGNCHAIAGTQWNGQAAPNLTHLMSRQIISAGVLENTPANLTTYLRNPQAVKPGIYMPNYRFNEQQIRALVAYLETLK